MIVECPRENQSVLIGDYYISLGRDESGRLLAIVTKGHPNAGDNKVEVCDIEIVKNLEEAAEWFTKSLTEKPWIPRQ
jgi:hypothetical protein